MKCDRNKKAWPNDIVTTASGRLLTSYGAQPIDHRHKVLFEEPIAEYSRRILDMAVSAKERKTCKMTGSISNKLEYKRDGNST